MEQEQLKKWKYNKQTHSVDEQPTMKSPTKSWYEHEFDKEEGFGERQATYNAHIASMHHYPVSGEVDWKDGEDVTGKFTQTIDYKLTMKLGQESWEEITIAIPIKEQPQPIKEQLKYKCIARYPHSMFIIGEIYTNEDCCKILNPKNVTGCLSVFDCLKYPAIFQSINQTEEHPKYSEDIEKILTHAVILGQNNIDQNGNYIGYGVEATVKSVMDFFKPSLSAFDELIKEKGKKQDAEWQDYLTVASDESPTDKIFNNIVNTQAAKIDELIQQNKQLKDQIKGMKKDTDLWILREKGLEKQIAELQAEKTQLMSDYINVQTDLQNKILNWKRN